MGIAEGGDDYIEKPFGLELLRAKIEAILRRTYQYKSYRKSQSISSFSTTACLITTIKLLKNFFPFFHWYFLSLISNNKKSFLKELSSFLIKWGYAIILVKEFENILSEFLTCMPGLVLMDIQYSIYDLKVFP